MDKTTYNTAPHYLILIFIDFIYEWDDSNIVNYADDTAFYVCAENIPELELLAFRIFKYFENNVLKTTPRKPHAFLISN